MFRLKYIILVNSFVYISFTFSNEMSLHSILNCTTPNGSAGFCVYDEECPPLMQIKYSKSKTRNDSMFLASSFCGYVREKLKVCCETKNTSSCPSIYEPTVESVCHYRGHEISCNEPMLNGVLMYSNCKPNHIPVNALNRLKCVNMTWDQPLPKCKYNCMYEWRCNAHLVIGERRYPVNRQIIQSLSQRFIELSSLNNEDVILNDMEDINSLAVANLLTFIHTNRTYDWQPRLYTDMIKFSHLLNINGIDDLCIKLLENDVNVNNYLELLQIYKKSNNSMLIYHVKFYIVDNFHELMLEEQWLNLDVSDLYWILERDDLNVECEGQVFEGLNRWMQKDWSRRKEHFTKMLKFIFLDRLPPKVILETIMKLCAEASKDCVPMLTDKVHWNNDLDVSKPTRKCRKYNKSTILIIGTYNLESMTIKIYNPDEGILSDFTDIKMENVYFSTVVLNRKLMIFGGKLNMLYDTNRVWSLDLGTKRLRELSEMKKKRSFSSAVVIDDLIYICGGFNPNDGYLNSVERYNPVDGTWSFMAPMLTTRYNHASTTYDGKMYVIGGLKGEEYLNSVEIYDPKLNQWTHGTPMQTHRISFSVAVVGDGLFAVGGYDGISYLSSVERLDLVNQKWMKVKAMPEDDVGVAVPYDNRIFMINRFVVHEYIPKKNVWKNSTGHINKNFRYFRVLPVLQRSLNTD
ncbi:kelch-like protein 36 [Arctopsyche grandis]|uniref:kelch-like protein 36 n=1 Tax=Arctopsyche grandis TaxID=121162 RepID=UPI00406D9AE4